MWRARSSLASLAVLVGLAPASAAAVRWADVLKQAPEWYAGAEAKGVADAVLAFQHPSGGWSKNVDMAAPHTPAEIASFTKDGDDEKSATIDNGATHTQLRFLAQVITARDDPRYRASFLRGFDYLLAAQYDNGGWPQFYPPRPGYYAQITFNDDAMIGTLRVLREAARGEAPFSFVDAARRERARQAVDKGVACILRCQVVVDGKRTAWCAQHDRQTLKPTWARTYEPPSLSGSESVGIVRFLMTSDASTETAAAIVDAVAWLDSVPLRGFRVETTLVRDGSRDRRLVADDAAQRLWARFYEIGSNRPIFMGRDSVAREFNDVELERRLGYAYLGTWPAPLLDKEYPEWLAARAAKPPRP